MKSRRKREFKLTREQLETFEKAEPNLVFKPLTEETAEDFKAVVRARFAPGTERQVDTLLANPLRKYCSSCGEIAYEYGKPACVQGAMLRRVYYRQTPYLMLNGSMFAKMPDASPVSTFGIMLRTLDPSRGIVLWFGNTGVKTSMEITSAVPVEWLFKPGPSSYCGQRIALIHPVPALWARFRSIHPRLPAFHWRDWSFSLDSYTRHRRDGHMVERVFAITDDAFGSFWNARLAANDGLLSSRSPEDLRWMYASRLKEGPLVLLMLKNGEKFVGYIIIRCGDAAGKCWSVVDMIAAQNDTKLLEILMREAVRFLRKTTPAMELAIAGFPTWVQPIIAKVFRHHVMRDHNSSGVSVYDRALEEFLTIADSCSGWFCGPADGDAWL